MLKILGVTAAVGLLSATVFWLSKPEPQKTRSDTKSEQAAVKPASNESDKVLFEQKPASSVKTKASSTNDDSKTVDWDASSAYEVEKWSREHGYFDEASIAEYRSYDNDSLVALAKSGDVNAIQTLALEALKSGDKETALKLYHEAAAYGSTKALIDAAYLFESDFRNASSEKQKIDLAIEMLALVDVAIRRGDRFLGGRFKSQLINMHPLNLTEKQQHTVEGRANKIYLDLSRKREALGLDAFNNTVPQEVRRLAEKSDRLD